MSLADRDIPSWDDINDRLWFQVDHRGQTISCCIDAHCLYLAFGARTPNALDVIKAYKSQRGLIHSAALGKAHRGGFERSPKRLEAFVHLTARDL
jgi:Protein of unknown function (DUF1488)